MTATVKVNPRGGITLPRSIRKQLGVDKGGTVMFELSPQGVLLRPAVSFPIEIYTDERIAEFDEGDRELGRYMAAKKNKGCE